MQSLATLLAENNGGDIHTIGRYVQAHIDSHWEAVFQVMQPEMVRLYEKIGDSVYGLYAQRLFKPVHDEFRALGMRATPRLPGSFMISREWGEEHDRQRWMWSKITAADGSALGTLAIAFYHNHIEIGIPRAFRVIALEATGKGAVIEALSQLSPDFRDAQDAKTEIAQYLASLEQQTPEA